MTKRFTCALPPDQTEALKKVLGLGSLVRPPSGRTFFTPLDANGFIIDGMIGFDLDVEEGNESAVREIVDVLGVRQP